MTEAVGRAANDPEVLRATNGLVGYLRDMVRASTAQIRDVEKYESRVWLGDLPAGISVLAVEADAVLTLDYEPPPLRPELPAVVVGHIRPADPVDPQVVPVLSERAPTVPPETEDQAHAGAVEEATRQEVDSAFGQWLVAWRTWAASELTARPRRALYEQLSRSARLLSQQDDQYEAVLAVGLLSWSPAEGKPIRRHLVTRRVDMRLDRRSAQVTVSLAGEGATRLEDHEFLAAEDGYSQERTLGIRERLASEGPSPLAEEVMDALRQWRDVGLDGAVDLDVGWEVPGPPDLRPRLTAAPAVVVRRRDRNALVEFYDRIAGSLAGVDAAAPLGLAQLLFPLDEQERMSWAASSAPHEAGLLGDDPLFPLATNQAQRDVLNRLSEDTAVVVQGPPGTGKTHTIANLVSALLAQGQRVLVTSQKDQALRVLREKLPEAVRDLCVLLAASSGAGSDELERSITALSDHAATSDVPQVEREIAALEARRADLQYRRARTMTEMGHLREAEVVEHPEIAPGYRGHLSAIARSVTAGPGRYDWLPPVSGVSADPPLTAQEALELRSFVLSATPARISRRTQHLPAAEDLPAADAVRGAVAAARHAQRPGLTTSPLTDKLLRVDQANLAEAQRLVSAAQVAVHALRLKPQAAERDGKSWTVAAVMSGFAGRSRLWEYVAAQADQALVIHHSLTSTALRSVNLPPAPPEALQNMGFQVERLPQHVSAGGRIKNRFPSKEQKDAQFVLDNSWIDGHPPATADDLVTLSVRLRALSATANLANAWAQVGMGVPPGPLEVQLSLLAEWADALRHVRELWSIRADLDSLLVAQGVRVPLSSAVEWDAVVQAVQTVNALIASRRAEQALTDVDEALFRLQQADGAPPELWPARKAVEDRDVDAYVTAVALLRQAATEQSDQARCDRLMARLRTAHPLFADVLQNTAAEQVWPDRLAELPAAWAWLTAAQFCERLRQPDRDQQLQQELDDVDERLATAVGELAAARAWRHCLRRMTQQQRSALQAYKSAMAAVGKGTGIYANRHRRQARDAMSVARDAVPAWVMTLADVVETIPSEPNSFDVVIVDEASQVGIEGAFLLWLAPRVIVVGDDKQCAPSAIKFGELRKVYDRLDSYLPETADWMKQGFDPKSNLYELLSARFPGVVRLTEHFRCMPEIIGWSSGQFYDHRLVPLRQYGADRLPPLRDFPVDGGYTEARDQRIRNEPEAKQIVETIVRLHEDPAYKGKSFGVVVLQGIGQVRLIDTLINESLDPDQREARQLRVGTPPEFQGDERDVIFLSMVVAEPGRALTRLEEQRRFNVAASRAKDQLWLFTSVGTERLSAKDLRYSLLSYMQSPPAVQGFTTEIGPVDADRLRTPFDSLFEQRVYLQITARGYAVAPQVPVEGKRIDLVVVGANGRLAVECDGDAFHTTSAQVRADIDRERDLRRVGWEFWRVRESEFIFDPDRALRPLWKELQRRGIEPGVTMPDTGPASNTTWVPADLPDEDGNDELDDPTLGSD